MVNPTITHWQLRITELYSVVAVMIPCDIAERNNNDLHEYPYEIEKRLIEAIKELNLEKNRHKP